MKGCLISKSYTATRRPSNVQRKSVSFFGSSESSEDEQELVEIYPADDWDRTPCAVTPKLSYKDILELYELKLSAPRSSPNPAAGFDPRNPTLLKGVPVALLPLYEAPPPSHPPPSTRPTIPSNLPPRPKFPPHKPSANALSSRFNFLPLMPVDDGTPSSSPPVTAPPSPPPPPQTATRSGLRNFQFLPIYSTEPEPEFAWDDEGDVHHDHNLSSPTSTPSLTSSSIDSTPSTPSDSTSPSVTPSASTSDSYFDLSHQTPFDLPNQTASVRKLDFLRMNDPLFSREGPPSTPYPLSSKLKLTAMPSPTLLPPSPFDLQGSLSKAGKYLNTQEDKLGDGEFGRKKAFPGRFSHDDASDADDELYFSFEKKHGDSSSSAEKRSSVELRPPSPVLVPFCKLE